MTIEYGVRDNLGNRTWFKSQERAKEIARDYGYVLLAREVSKPWVVSIRN